MNFMTVYNHFIHHARATHASPLCDEPPVWVKKMYSSPLSDEPPLWAKKTHVSLLRVFSNKNPKPKNHEKNNLSFLKQPIN